MSDPSGAEPAGFKPGQYGFGAPTPSKQDVAFFHRGADTDQGAGAIHHTLGEKPGQAAPGSSLQPLRDADAELAGDIADIQTSLTFHVLASEDLDTVVTTGIYRQITSGGAGATVARHYPVARGGVLQVLNAIDSPSGEQYAVQNYYSRSGTETDATVQRAFTRFYRNGSWSTWRDLTPLGLPGTVSTTGTGSAASINRLTGVIPFTACTAVILDNCFEDGFDYKITLLGVGDSTTFNTVIVLRSTVPANITAANYQRHVGPEAANSAVTDLPPNAAQTSWAVNAATARRQETELTLREPRSSAVKVGRFEAYSSTDTGWASSAALKNAIGLIEYRQSVTAAGFKMTFSNAASGRIMVERIPAV